MDGKEYRSRKKRMIRQGIFPVQCDIVKNMDYEDGLGIIKELRLRKVPLIS